VQWRGRRLLRNDDSLRRLRMKIVEECETPGSERPHADAALTPGQDHFLERRRPHLEFVRSILLIGDDQEEWLAGGNTQLERRETVRLEHEGEGLEVFRA
jgi:hypothetical protein